MKSKTFNKAAAFAVCAVACFMACKKEAVIFQPEIRNFDGKAFVKVYNSVVNSNRNFVYVDDVPITGVGLNFATTPLFPSVSYYSVIQAGNRNFLIKDTLLTTTQKPITFSSAFDEGSNYTVFTYDTLNNTKYLVVKDNIENPTDTTSRLRLANLIYNRTALPNVDIYSIKLKKNIFSNVGTTSVTDFVSYQSGLADTLFVRATGTTTNLAQLNNFVPTQRRSYTIVYRGNYPTTSGTLARSLTQFVNF
jgi:hypothetical protein